MTSKPSHEKTDQVFVEKSKSELERRVKNLLAICGQTTPPIDLYTIADHCGIVEILESDVDAHGLLIPIETGFRVQIKASLPSVRKRSTLAHEIAHTFFYESSSPPARKKTDWLDHPWREEGVCSEIARQILVPASMMKSFLTRRQYDGLSIEVMEALAREFAVSLDIIVRRIQDEKLSDAVFIFLEQSQSKQMIPSLPMLSSGKLRIAGICSFIAKNSSFKETADIAARYGLGNCTLRHPKTGTLRVTCKRINTTPLRVFALATQSLTGDAPITGEKSSLNHQH